ncbi:MAG: pilus assembly PilX N-terminal domain-containing protein [Bacillota bacterium]|nr:pilus assembly PilX N-terminal domain-containing protein [Bacillota bacterium]MDW7683212.1 pilus assembly PilX N-terminal domain-containing protein [Bacillota bacterium]
MLWDNKGSAMPVVLLIMFVLTILGTALWQYFMNDTLQVARAGKQLQAYYLARSGVEVGLGKLEAVLNDGSLLIRDINDLDAELNNVGWINDIDTGQFDITYQVDTVNDNVVILSTGEVSDVGQSESLKVEMHFPNFGLPLHWFNHGYVANSIEDPLSPPAGYNAPDDMTGEIVFISTNSKVGHPIKQSSGAVIYKASFISFIDAEPSLELQPSASMYLESGAVAFKDKIYLRNGGYLYLRSNPGHTLETTYSTTNADGSHEVGIHFTFGSYDFNISGIRVAAPFSGSETGMVSFNGDIRQGSAGGATTILSVGSGGKYYFYKNNTEVHNFASEIAAGNLVEILNPEVLEDIFILGEGLPTIKNMVWGDN